MSGLSRRDFLEQSILAAAATTSAASGLWAADDANNTRQATGVKIGEVTDRSALVWMRLTAQPARNATGEKFEAKAKKAPKLADDANPDSFHGACPGAAGWLRVRYGTQEDLSGALTTDWAAADPAADYAHTFALRDLKPATTYYYAAETAGPDKTPHAPLRGRFATAPGADQAAPISFTVVTCQGYHDLDQVTGYRIYEAMLNVRPQFFVQTGDNVYYDNDAPAATSTTLARYHWHRMHSLPTLVAFHAIVPAYFEKDDHDVLSNDCWPTMKSKSGSLTFADGQRIFREQTPQGEKTYRTFRWGRDLQIWLTEGRDFRSANTDPDGPEKTIWGAEQKRWLKETLKASDATWKLLISPTALVGPDRGNKGDNHANAAFATEGHEFREWAKQELGDRFFVCCGDRHWQYHSVHPETGMHEFSVGPASDAHASGSPGFDAQYHKFHREKGGFLSVQIVSAAQDKPGKITFRLHDVLGEVVHEYSAQTT